MLSSPVVQLPERAEKRASPMKKSLPFFGSTEYGDMHTGPGFNLDDDTGDMAGYKPRPEESAPFDGRTEARSAFVPHPLDGTRKGTKAKSHGIGVGEGAFQGATESREAFPGHNVRACSRVADSDARLNCSRRGGDCWIVAHTLTCVVTWCPELVLR